MSSQSSLKQNVIPKIKIKTNPTHVPDEFVDIKHIPIPNHDNYTINKIYHIADIHIGLYIHLKDKLEYTQIFDKFFDEIKQNGTDNAVVVIAGDLITSKSKLNSEMIKFARTFLKNLTTLCPTIVILGNHDFNQTNPEYTDSLYPLCTDTDVISLIDTGVYKIGNILWSFSSLRDGKFIKANQINNPNNLSVIALYHGTIIGSKNANGTVNNIQEVGYHRVSEFDHYDAVMLGHIHKRQLLTEKMAYSGSLIAQNTSEIELVGNQKGIKIKGKDHESKNEKGHGYILWNRNINISINNKEWIPQFKDIDNDYCHIKIKDSMSQEEIDNIISINGLTNKKLKVTIQFCSKNKDNRSGEIDVESYIKDTYNIEGIKYCKLNEGKGKDVKTNDGTENVEMLGHVDIHNLIKDINPIYATKLIEKYNIGQYIPSADGDSTMLHNWNITEMEFKNVFIYGNDHDNVINFVTGVNNLCSPNKTGKTSICNTILYALFERTANDTKATNSVLNVNKTDGRIKLTIVSYPDIYIIEKNIHMNTKMKITSKTLFYKNSTLLNADTETETKKLIEKYFGDFDKFSLHQMISTKIHSSIFSMSPADRLKHFHNLFNTNYYDSVYKSMINDNKTSLSDKLTLETKISEVKKQMKYLNEHISDDRPLISEKDTLVNKRETNNELLNKIIDNITSLEIDLSKYTELIENTVKAPQRSIEQLNELFETEIYNDIVRDGLTSVAIKQKLTKIEKELSIDGNMNGNMNTKKPISKKLPKPDMSITELKELFAKYKSIKFPVLKIDVDEYDHLHEQLLNWQCELPVIISLYNSILPVFDETYMNLTSISKLEIIDEQQIRSTLEKIKSNKQLMSLLSDKQKPPKDDKYSRYCLEENKSKLITGKKKHIPSGNKFNELSISPHFIDEILELFHEDHNPNNENEIIIKGNNVSQMREFLTLIKDGTYQRYIETCKDIEFNNQVDESSKVTKYLNHYLYEECAQNEQSYQQYIANCLQTIMIILKYHNNMYKKITKQIEWYELDRIETITNEYNLYKKYLQQLDIHDDLEKYQKIADSVQYTDIINSLKTKLKGILIERNNLKSTIDNQNKRINAIEQLIKINEINRDRCSELSIELNNYVTSLDQLKENIILLEKGIEIFHPDCLSFKILESYLKNFCEHCDMLLNKLTGYKFTYTQEKGKLMFYVSKSILQEVNVLSGYESIILQLSINNALEGLIGGKFLIVDESFDCIDQNRFITELPDTINIMRKYYQSILLISHRDLPDDIIDKNIKIKALKDWSMII